MLLLAIACETAALPATSTSAEREDVAGCRTEGTVTTGEVQMLANGLYNGWGEQSVWDYSWSGGWSHEAFTRDESGCVTTEELRRIDAGIETVNQWRTSDCNHAGDPISQIMLDFGVEQRFDIKNEYQGSERERAETYSIGEDEELVLVRWDEWEYHRSGGVERWEVGYGEDGEVAESTTYAYYGELLAETFYIGTQGAWIEQYTYNDAGLLVETAFDSGVDSDIDALEVRRYDAGWDWPVLFELENADDRRDRVETRAYDCP